MRFAGTEWATPPAPEEIEITLIGPGYGECVIVHLGSGRWMIVDSCIDASTQAPAALSYLASMNMDPSVAVEHIVATHWHDDHVRGLDAIVAACPRAKFICSIAMRRSEFHQMLDAYARQPKLVGGRGVDAIKAVFDHIVAENRTPGSAQAMLPLLRYEADQIAHGRTVVVTALSPSDREIESSREDIASLKVKINTDKRPAVSPSANHFCVALWITIGSMSVLLGADLENHSDDRIGWRAVLSDARFERSRAALIKVPHHGGESGHHIGVWEQRLEENSVALVAPWGRGGRVLPTQADIDRLRQLTTRAFLTSEPTPSRVRGPWKSPAVTRTLNEMNARLWQANPELGTIRTRINPKKDATWSIQLSSGARSLGAISS